MVYADDETFSSVPSFGHTRASAPYLSPHVGQNFLALETTWGGGAAGTGIGRTAAESLQQNPGDPYCMPHSGQ